MTVEKNSGTVFIDRAIDERKAPDETSFALKTGGYWCEEEEGSLGLL